MDVTQSLAVIAEYRERLDISPLDAPMDWSPTEVEQRQHLAHMLDRMEEMLDTKRFPVTNWDKFNRWLGFVQGCFWNLGEYTLNEMREHNTRPTKPFVKGTGVVTPIEWAGKTPAEIEELRKAR